MSENTVELSNSECAYWIEHRASTTEESLDTWEPVSKPSQVVQELIDKLRNQHDACVSEIFTNLTQINQEIESDIRIKSHDLKHDLNVYKKTGYNAINNLQSSQTEILSFDETEFIKIKSFCMNLIQQAKFKINNYYTFLQDVEKYRAAKFKVILQNGYMQIQKCSYKLPYEMQQFFENQIIHLNQMVLANLRNYKELQVNLTLTFNNDIKLMTYKITEYETKWRELCKDEILTRFKQHDIREEKFEEIWNNTRCMSAIVKLVDDIINKQMKNKQLSLQMKEIYDEEWCKYMLEIIENFDESSTNLAKIYAQTAEQLGTNDFNLDDLKSKLLEIKIKESLELTQDHNTESYQILWQNTLQCIVKHLHTYYVYISAVFDRWEKYMKRVEAKQLTVLNNLGQITQKHDTALQNKHGRTLDKAVNTLRQQTDEKALQKSYKTVCSILDKIKHMMKANKEAELKIINKYNETVRKENELLTKELRELLGKTTENDECVEELDDELRNDKTLVLFNKLQLCEDGFSELKEHRNKLQESLYQYIESSLDQQRNQATLWIAMETEKHCRNFEDKMLAHEQRYDSIRLELYDVRLTDIREHISQFMNHQTSIEQRLAQLKKNIRTFEDQLRPEIDQMTVELSDLCADSKKSKFPAHASTYLIRATRMIEDKIRIVKEQVRSYQDQCNGDVDELIKDNDKYRLQIKTFEDGGNYSVKEASTFIKKLQQLETYCKKKSTELKQEINEVEKYIIKEIHQTSPAYIKLLESILNTAKCQEHSSLQLAAVQNELRKEAYVLKYQRKRIDTIKGQVQGHNDSSSGDFVIKHCKELIAHCKEHGEYLEQPDVPSTIKPMCVEENLTQRSILKGGKSPKSKGKSIVEFRDYRQQLFDCFTISDNKKFMPKICNILYTALTNIQASAKEFYSKEMLHNLEHISISLNYDTYMSEVLNKLKYYYIQCAELWIQEVQYFTNVTNEIPVFIKQYCNNIVLNVHYEQMNKVTTEYKGYLENVRKASLQKINELRIQLKPLHGYHANKQLLDDLTKQMSKVQTEVKHEIAVSLTTYEEALEDFRKEYYDIMSCVKDITDSLKTVLEVHTFDIKLSAQAESCITVLNSLNILDSACETIVSADNITATDYLKLPENTQAIPDINLENVCQNFEEELSDQKMMIDEFKIQMYKDLSMLEIIWNNDLDKILKLYTVTYE